MVITECNQQNKNKKKCVNYKEKYDFDPRPENERSVFKVTFYLLAMLENKF